MYRIHTSVITNMNGFIDPLIVFVKLEDDGGPLWSACLRQLQADATNICICIFVFVCVFVFVFIFVKLQGPLWSACLRHLQADVASSRQQVSDMRGTVSC